MNMMILNCWISKTINITSNFSLITFHTKKNLDQVNTTCLAEANGYLFPTHEDKNEILRLLRMRKQITRTTVPLYAVPQRRTEWYRGDSLSCKLLTTKETIKAFEIFLLSSKIFPVLKYEVFFFP